jgi:hypothetical protein
MCLSPELSVDGGNPLSETGDYAARRGDESFSNSDDAYRAGSLADMNYNCDAKTLDEPRP